MRILEWVDPHEVSTVAMTVVTIPSAGRCTTTYCNFIPQPASILSFRTDLYKYAAGNEEKRALFLCSSHTRLFTIN